MRQANKYRSLAFVGMALVAVCGSASTARAQFLEKLEAAVRAQLEQQGSTQQPSSQPESSPPQQVQQAAEELPPPSQSAGAARSSPQSSPRNGGRNSSPLDGPSLVPSVDATQELPVPAPVNAESQAAQEQPSQTYLGLDAEEPSGGGIGVRVVDVAPDSPAWKAGFKVGDRILAVNGFAIAGLDAMVEQLSPIASGEAVRFLVTRNNRNIELVAVLQDARLAAKLAAGSRVGPAWMGVTVADLTPAFRQQFGVNLFRAAAVTEVTPNSPAARAGIRAGDAIAEVSGERIEDARDFVERLANAKPGEVLELTVSKGVTVRQVLVTLEERTGGSVNGEPASSRPLRSQSRIPLPSTVTVQQLSEEVARLRSELDEATRKLQTTQRQLDAILKALNGGNASEAQAGQGG